MREYLINKLWRGVDPFRRYRVGAVDVQGWDASSHPWLLDAIRELDPKLVVEVGVWKGASTLAMAEEMWRLGIPGVILAVDTFQGSAEHWLGEYKLPMNRGHSTLYDIFLRNVVAYGLLNYVVPLPIDSINAAMVLRDLGVVVDMIHLDAAHDAMSVSMDLQAWWPLLRDGGVLIGDDYCEQWPGVVQAFDAFAGRYGVALEVSAPKVRLMKP